MIEQPLETETGNITEVEEEEFDKIRVMGKNKFKMVCRLDRSECVRLRQAKVSLKELSHIIALSLKFSCSEKGLMDQMSEIGKSRERKYAGQKNHRARHWGQFGHPSDVSV